MNKYFLLLFLSFFPLLCSSENLAEKDPKWSIARGEKDRDRLSILNDLYNPSSLSLLALSPGMRVLTIGCGTGLLELEIAQKVGPAGFVLGIDINREQLKIAEENRLKADVGNLRFIEMDIADLAQIAEQFDRVHIRFVLSHFPWAKVTPLIPLLYDKVAPGGTLLIEEIATLDNLSCLPHSTRGYDLWKLCFDRQFSFQGSDPSPGNRLHHYLKEQGYSLSYTSHQPLLSTPREKAILTLGVRAVSEKLVKNQFLTAQEVEEMIHLLGALEQTPTLSPLYVEVSQILINKIFPN